MIRKEVVKQLSPNDVGTTGAHQAGILVPKAPEVLAFFPSLNGDERNPRASLTFRDDDGLTKWQFEFIYYNNKLFGGTRNEYRLTWMTKYLRAKNALPGDEVVLTKDERGFQITLRRSAAVQEPDGDEVLRLSGGWKVITTMRGW